MVPTAESLPNDVPALKERVIWFATECEYLRESLHLLRAQIFGRKSERQQPAGENPQLSFLDEETPPASAPTPTKLIQIPAHQRLKPGRRPLPEDLPRIDIIHDATEAQKICGCGAHKACIGYEESEQLDYVPASLQVLRHVRLKWACVVCEGVDDDPPSEAPAAAPVPATEPAPAVEPAAPALSPQKNDVTPAGTETEAPPVVEAPAADQASAGHPQSVADADVVANESSDALATGVTTLRSAAVAPQAPPAPSASVPSVAPAGGLASQATANVLVLPYRPVVVIAPAPPTLIPKSFASPGLVAHIITAKYADAIPLYRQEAQFRRLGVDLGRHTMCGWLFKTSEACAPLMVLLRQELLSGPLVGCDESRFQVLKEPGRSPTTLSQMWLFRGGPLGHPVVEYLYDQSRSGQVPRAYLQGFEGYVQTDGYVGYDFLDELPGVIHLGCMAHARRKFVEVIKATALPAGAAPGGVAQEVVASIKELYAIEALADEARMTYEERYTLRQQESKPRLEVLHQKLEAWAPKVPPKCTLGGAISYTLEQWPRLERYLEQGFLRPDNNLVENDIRPFALGRKNWLFADTPEGAVASSRFYTLVQNAKLSGLDPYYYLRHIFHRLPYASTEADYRKLLPHSVKAAWEHPQL